MPSGAVEQFKPSPGSSLLSSAVGDLINHRALLQREKQEPCLWKRHNHCLLPAGDSWYSPTGDEQLS